MNTPHPPSISWDEGLERLMKNRPGFTAAYVESAAEGATDEVGIALFVKALHRVAKFRGMTEVAEKAGMTPASLSRALSGRGNPTHKTLVSIMQAVGMKFSVTPIETPPAPKKRAVVKRPKSPRKATA